MFVRKHKILEGIGGGVEGGGWLKGTSHVNNPYFRHFSTKTFCNHGLHIKFDTSIKELILLAIKKAT